MSITLGPFLDFQWISGLASGQVGQVVQTIRDQLGSDPCAWASPQEAAQHLRRMTWAQEADLSGAVKYYGDFVAGQGLSSVAEAVAHYRLLSMKNRGMVLSEAIQEVYGGRANYIRSIGHELLADTFDELQNPPMALDDRAVTEFLMQQAGDFLGMDEPSLLGLYVSLFGQLTFLPSLVARAAFSLVVMDQTMSQEKRMKSLQQQIAWHYHQPTFIDYAHDVNSAPPDSQGNIQAGLAARVKIEEMVAKLSWLQPPEPYSWRMLARDLEDRAVGYRQRLERLAWTMGKAVSEGRDIVVLQDQEGIVKEFGVRGQPVQVSGRASDRPASNAPSGSAGAIIYDLNAARQGRR